MKSSGVHQFMWFRSQEYIFMIWDDSEKNLLNF